jgi:DNA (cytosine-5)-methyltransferase 1
MFDGYRIRRLTPIECERLQGFPDNHTAFGNYDGEVKPMSNTQRYKQCGNAVTVDVVQAVANQCKPLFK